MQEYSDEYLNYIRFERKLSYNTIESYAFDLNTFNEYLKDNNLTIQILNETNIMNYLKFLSDKKKLNSRSVERHLTTLRNYFK